MARVSAALLLVSSITNVCSRDFVDDLGVRHTFTGTAARIAAEGHVAISLLHFGMRPQAGHLAAVWGGVAGRGSTDMDELMSGEPWSHHDPTPSEVNSVTGSWFVDGTVQNLSSCFGPWNCRDVDWTLLPTSTDFVIIYGTLPFSLDATLNQTLINKLGNVPIFISRQYESTPSTGCSHVNGAYNCFQRSTIDIVKRFDQLASFLGYEDADTIAADRLRMCKATETFTAAAKRAQDLGMVTAMAAIYPLGSGTTAFLFNPILDASQMLTFEQLGLPILYPGKCGAECGWTNSYTPVESLLSYKQFNCTPQISCNDNPFYKIDFWFLEGGSLRGFVSNQAWLEANFPDKALLAGQYHQREVICYNEAYHKADYKDCGTPPSSTSTDNEGLSTGSVAAIACGCVVGGLCLGCFGAYLFFQNRKGEPGKQLSATPYGKAEV